MGNTRYIRQRQSRRAVHPHVHGEHKVVWLTARNNLGSSPRTWGTQSCESGPHRWYRFIPTYMGNTRTNSTSGTWTTVHPHVHGEHREGIRYLGSYRGSSPRTWGTHSHNLYPVGRDRFIPTYMGNTQVPWVLGLPGPVHPHVHGEHGRRRSGGCLHSVHPHVHGEHRRLRRIRRGRVGSSPRTWGTRGDGDLRDTGRRFIPTYMGNTTRQARTTDMRSVHPHVHGEHAEREGLCDVELRFIPTYMGNTGTVYRGGAHAAVHPHVHGEHNLSVNCRRSYPGSSPRTWGTPVVSVPTVYCRRSSQYMGTLPKFKRNESPFVIPTYMGNTIWL